MTFTVCNWETIDAVVAEWDDRAARAGRRFSSRPSYALNWYNTTRGRGELAVCAVDGTGPLWPRGGRGSPPRPTVRPNIQAESMSVRRTFCRLPAASSTRRLKQAACSWFEMSIAGQGGARLRRTHRTNLGVWDNHYDDPDVRRYQPGHLIMKWLRDQHNALGIDRFDLLIAEIGFESEWANRSRDVATPRTVAANWLDTPSHDGSMHCVKRL